VLATSFGRAAASRLGELHINSPLSSSGHIIVVMASLMDDANITEYATQNSEAAFEHLVVGISIGLLTVCGRCAIRNSLKK
jgi:hypothetical protein